VLYGQINDDYDDYDHRIDEYKDHESRLSNMFTADPRSAHFLSEWANGGDPVVSLVRQFGTDIMDAINDPDRQEEIADANREYLERVAKERDLDEQYQQNLSESLDYLGQLQQERGLSDDEIDETMEFLVGIVKDGILGKFSPESIDMAMKALHHDGDVAIAGHEGEVKGRNSKIEERLRRRSSGDGTAMLDGKNNGQPTRHTPSLGVLDEYGDGMQTIWERGGERRTKGQR